MLFRLPSLLLDVLSLLGVFNVAERMRVDPVLATLVFHRVIETDQSYRRGPHDFI